MPGVSLELAEIEEVLTREQAIEALRAWDRAQPGRGRTQRQYIAWQVGSEHPALATLQRVARFSELRAAALKLNATNASTLCPPPDRATAGATPSMLRAIAAGPARTLSRAVARPGRSVFRGPRPWLSHVIAAGLLSTDERLVADHCGTRHTASFNADGDITVAGHPEPVATLNQAAALVTTSKIGGWRFWNVIRDDKYVPLDEFRTDLADRSAASRDGHHRLGGWKRSGP
jgi:hypothetical protein